MPEGWGYSGLFTGEIWTQLLARDTEVDKFKNTFLFESELDGKKMKMYTFKYISNVSFSFAAWIAYPSLHLCLLEKEKKRQ